VAQKAQQDIQLNRALGLFEVTLSGLGIILGAGIYALISEATALAGNALWISFIIAAIVAIITGLSYAELASIFPKASAEYEYTAQAFNKGAAFVVGWLIIFQRDIRRSYGCPRIRWIFPSTRRGSSLALGNQPHSDSVNYFIHRNKAVSDYCHNLHIH